MKTKPSLKQSPSGSVSIVLEIPSDFIPETTPQQVQTLLRRFFFENPQILRQAFEASKENTTEQKEMTLALQALENIKPSKVKENATQLLREIRNNE